MRLLRVSITSPPYFKMRDYGTGEDQRGLEDNMNDFLIGLVKDFSDCKRVLKDNGSLWVNLGEAVLDGQYNAIPHRFVVAMMNDGWIFNDEIVWIKKNPIFTNNANRTIRSHEYIFHFVKSSNFYYDSSWTTQLSDRDNLVSLGTSGKISKLISAMDFRESIVKTSGNNMDDLRKACKEKGFFLTHNAAFPLSIPAMAILTTSQVGDTVLDIYSGTATTGEASLELGRNYVGYEVKPEFILSSAVRLERFLEDTSIPEMLRAA
jgi:DNA modification methylase